MSFANGSVPSASHIIQLIDEKQCLNEKAFADFLKSATAVDGVVHDCDFRIVSVLGSQSSGKSTLLNALFGTGFDVMSESKRSQTTKGIWMSQTVFSSEILVMDVEGTDGRERGDDQGFERKSALFSMALSEVLIVNMWEHSVGLYNGANMSLLKTVFEVNMELFASKDSPKTLLLFVIRDFLGQTSLHELSQILTDDLHKIWSSIAKPADLTNSCLFDFFTIDFWALPHKVLKAEEFKSKVSELGTRFFDKSAPNYFFADASAFKKSVPVDGLSFYLSNIWTQIINNKNLDLPTQQQLLSQFRCDEISKECAAVFRNSLAPFESLGSGKVFDEDFLEQAISFKRICLFSYESESHRYHRDIASAKAKDLEKEVNSAIISILSGLAKCLCREAIEVFSKSFLEKSSSKALKSPSSSFKDRILKAKSEAEEYFDRKSNYLCSEDFPEFKRESFCNVFADGIKIKTENFVMNQCRVQMDKQRVLCFNQLDLFLGCFLVDFGEKEGIFRILFAKIAEIFDENCAKFTDTLKSNLATDSMSAEFTSEFADILNRQINKKLQELLTVEKLSASLYKIFEKNFKLEKSGMPKIWSPSDNIESAYVDALSVGLSLIKLIKTEKISEAVEIAQESSKSTLISIDCESFAIFSGGSVDSLEETYKKLCESTFVETKRSLTASKTHIPLWVVVLLVVLGWNEFMTVLKNPLYLLLGLVLGTAVYFIYMLNLQGPTLAFIRHTFHSITKEISSHLKPAEAAADPPTIASEASTSNHIPLKKSKDVSQPQSSDEK